MSVLDFFNKEKRKEVREYKMVCNYMFSYISDVIKNHKNKILIITNERNILIRYDSYYYLTVEFVGVKILPNNKIGYIENLCDRQGTNLVCEDEILSIVKPYIYKNYKIFIKDSSEYICVLEEGVVNKLC